MLDKLKTLDLVREFLQREFELAPERIQPEANLFTDLELDSIDVLDLVIQLEEEYQIEIVEEDLKKVRTIGDVVDYIASHAPEGMTFDG
jgi:acyl carrier protein